MTDQQSFLVYALFDRGYQIHHERYTAVLRKCHWAFIGGKHVVAHECLTIDNKATIRLGYGFRHGHCVIGPWLGKQIEWKDIPGKIRQIILEKI